MLHDRMLSSGSNPNSRQSAAATPDPTQKASRTSAHRGVPYLLRYLLGPFKLRMALRIRSRSSISHPLNFITSDSSGLFSGCACCQAHRENLLSPPLTAVDSYLTGATHFVFDALPVCMSGFARLHMEGEAAIQRLHGRRFSFLTTGLSGTSLGHVRLCKER